ncbi:MAG TPA: ribulose-phosphate 3-epimerase [Rhodothermales bacterium]|nr:ribulose-phosphate 3-epimerase [Rhodothermales bacterium]
MTVFAASILAADFAELNDQTRLAVEAGSEWIHVDVMDGHFVPNITMGPIVVSALRPLAAATNAVMDVHLMIENADAYLEDFVKAGADVLSVHVEACPHLHRTVGRIRELGARACVALNPATALDTIREILPDVDMVVVMSVNPGFAGQKFIPGSLDKVRRLRRILDEIGSQARVEIDGGVSPANAAEIVAAGADVLVAGSAIFKGDIAANVAELRRAVSVSV